MLRQLVLLTALFGTSAVLRADTFHFTFEADSLAPGGGSGVLQADPFTGQNGESFYRVTSITGQVDGAAITGLLPSSAFADAFTSTGTENNIIQYEVYTQGNPYPTGPPFYTIMKYFPPSPGLAFSAANGREYNLVQYSEYTDLVWVRNSDGSNLPPGFPFYSYPLIEDRTVISIEPVATPEPADAVLVGTGGFAMLLLAWCRRRKAIVAESVFSIAAP